MHKITKNIDTIFLMLIALCILVGSIVPKVFGIAPILIGLLFSLGFLFSSKKQGILSFLKSNKAILYTTFIFLTYIMLSNLWSISPSTSLEKSIKIVVLFLSGIGLLAATSTLSKQTITKNLWMIPVVTAVGLGLNLIELLFDYPFYRLTHPNDLDYVGNSLVNRSMAVLTMLSFPSILIIGQSDFLQGRKKCAVMLPYLALLLSAIILSGSETAKLCLILVPLFLLLFPAKSYNSWMILSISIIFLAIASPWASSWTFNHFVEAVNKNSILGKGGAHGAQRLEIYDFTSKYALQKPLTGHGIEASKHIRDFDTQNIYQKKKRISHPHNFAIQLWLELGITGVLLFGLLFHQIIQKLSFIAKEQWAAIAVLITSLSFYGVSYGLWQSWLIGLNFLTIAIILMINDKTSA